MKTLKFTVDVEVPDEWNDEESLSMVADWLSTAKHYHADAMVCAQAASPEEFVNEEWRKATIESHRESVKAIHNMIKTLTIVSDES